MCALALTQQTRAEVDEGHLESIEYTYHCKSQVIGILGVTIINWIKL